MSTLTALARMSVLAAVALAGIGLSANAARACDYYYRTVTTYVAVQQPVAYYVTRYDHCGDAFQVHLVSYRAVRVPVTTRVKVYY